ncbi:D-2-hydroxyacid dehydrogenase [Lampropedia puyangensis]|uniref:D-2-hydroxyacid dehydrogenase n=1 Tax=Lampropedia puyangensis TaxID=1330072 RepID=A0A4S8F7H4_9BURK|nr:D-2-hydroxyacid dehydrogenase [Lampropedia puyangensis]THU02595.1 D-2-hydroxyacid dehydrogenase [Lampropedia puyangensis]
MKIVFLDRATLSPETVLKPLSFSHDLEVFDRTAPHEVAERIADADVVILNKVALTAEALEKATRLRLVAVAATGTDNIDLVACQARGIAVRNVRNYAIHTVPEHTFALIFALRRSVCAYRGAVLRGRWQEAAQFCFFDYPIRDLAGSTLGIIGDGVLGQAVGQMGKALGMRVLFAARKGQRTSGGLYTPFEQTLEQSDVLTLHCPLTPENQGLIGLDEFQRMLRQPLLINTARGGLVDEQAMEQALDKGWIAGAGFDVASPEPPPAEHPLMRLANRPNVILTPHIAWASSEAIQGLADQLIDNIEHFVRTSQ